MTDTAAIIDDVDTLLDEALDLGDGEQAAQVQSKPDPPRYALHNGVEALQPQPPIDWIVENLFSARSVSLVVGDPGSKKTWAMLSLAVCVSIGQPWLGFQTSKSPVLLIDEESGARRMNRRLGDVLRGHAGADGKDIWFTALAGFNYLANPQDLNELQTLVNGSGARLVIIDALIDVMLGFDENSAGDVGALFHGLRQVAESTGVAIAVVHHSNKNGSYRGSSAMCGAVDLMLSVESKEGSTRIDFNCEKARDIDPHKFAAVANFVPDMFNLSVASASESTKRLPPACQHVIDYLADNGNSELKDIKESGGGLFAETTLRDAVRRLVQDEGKVERKDRGGKGSKAIYGLVELDPMDVADNPYGSVEP